MKEFISLERYRRRNNFVLAWGFEYMNSGGCHPRAETLKTDLKRGSGAARLVLRQSTEALRAFEDQVCGDELEKRQETSTGTKRMPVAGWGQKNASCPAWMLVWALPLGRNVPGVCVMKGCLPLRILTQECFRLQSGWPPPDQYSSQAFSVLFCYLG